MSAQLSPRTLALVLVAVIVLLGAGGWFGLVASQRSSVSSLEAEVADAQVNLDALTAAAGSGTGSTTPAKGASKKKQSQATQTALLQKAFPTEVAMPSILLQVQRLATASGVTLDAFAPGAMMPQSGFGSIPIDVKVSGRYRGIQRFVHALRVHAGAGEGGKVHASGRLFAVETVGITAATDGLPDLVAQLRLDAYVYTGVVPVTETATDGETSTTAEGTS
jgi:Tfp pilus assembly protein PilO